MRAAFDIRRESPELRDRYGRHLFGQSMLMGRRMLEAVTAFAERGEVPYETRNADNYRVRSAALVLPRDVAWTEGAADALLARV